MKLNPYLSVLAGATIAATSGIFIKLLQLPAVSLAFFRLIVPVVVLAAYFIYQGKKTTTSSYKIMLVVSVLNAIRMFLYIIAFLYTPIANAVIILYSWPIFASIYSIFLLKEQANTKVIILLTMAFAGLIVMNMDKDFDLSSQSFWGMSAMLLSAAIYALTSVILKQQLEKHSGLETIFYQNLVGALIFLFLFLNNPLPSLAQTTIGITYGFLVGIVAFMLFFHALKQIKVSHYSLMSYWEVVAAVFFGVLLFDETFSINILIGGIMIILAGFLLKSASRR